MADPGGGGRIGRGPPPPLFFFFFTPGLRCGRTVPLYPHNVNDAKKKKKKKQGKKFFFRPGAASRHLESRPSLFTKSYQRRKALTRLECVAWQKRRSLENWKRKKIYSKMLHSFFKTCVSPGCIQKEENSNANPPPPGGRCHWRLYNTRCARIALKKHPI